MSSSEKENRITTVTAAEGTSSSCEPESLLRRLRIEEIKERRRRFHKETAERWILEQQFGVGEDQAVRDASAKAFTDSKLQFENRTCFQNGENNTRGDNKTPVSDRNSFLNAFEFFAKSEAAVDAGCSGDDNNPSRVLLRHISKPRPESADITESDFEKPGSIRFEERKAAWQGRTDAKPTTTTTTITNGLRLEFDGSQAPPPQVGKLHSPPPTTTHHPTSENNSNYNSLRSSSSSSSPPTPSSADAAVLRLCNTTDKSPSPPLSIRKKPSIPDILVVDPALLNTDDQLQGDLLSDQRRDQQRSDLSDQRRDQQRSDLSDPCRQQQQSTAARDQSRFQSSLSDPCRQQQRSSLSDPCRQQQQSSLSAPYEQQSVPWREQSPQNRSDLSVPWREQSPQNRSDLSVPWREESQNRSDLSVPWREESQNRSDLSAPIRRRPSSILKKRDSSITSDENHGASVSFACEVDPGDEDEEAAAYRRRSRSYSGSSSTGRRSPRRRNSAEGHFPTDEFQTNRQGILKHSCSSLSVDAGTGSTHSDEFKSILKQPARRSSLGSNIHTAHHHQNQNRPRFSDDYDFIDSSTPTQSQGQRSILKRKSSTSSSQPDVSTSSLRSTASSYSSRESLHEPDPKPILKKKSSSEEISDSDYNSTSITPPPPRPILKNKTSESIPILVHSSESHHHPIKPCLKKPCKSFDESTLWSNNGGSNLECNSVEKSIMRKSSPHICSVKRCEEDSNDPEDDDEEEEEEDNLVTQQARSRTVLFNKRRDSEPLPSSSPASTSSGFLDMDDSSVISRRGSSGSFSFKRKHQIELGKIDFSGVYDANASGKPTTSSSPTTTDTTSSSGISSPGGPSSSSSPTKKNTTTTTTTQQQQTGQGLITQKIAALQISGESGWKKRVSKPNPEFEIVDNSISEATSKRAVSNGILANRLSMLESSQESWRKRVGEKDAKEFTVQGKLERAGKKVIAGGAGDSSASSDPTSPTTDLSSFLTTPKKKQSSSSFKNVFRGIRGSKTDESIVNRAIHIGPAEARGGACVMIAYSSNGDDESSSFSSKSIFQRSKSMRYGRVSSSPQQQQHQQSEQKSNASDSVSGGPGISSQHVVTVPVIKNDNETFTRFFQSASNLDPNIPVIVEDESFNSVILPEDSRQLLGNKRHIKLARNKERGVRNPIKALAGRIGLQQQSYVDLNPEIRERENIRRRIQMENSTSATHAHLSIEALAGLASKEDFTSVKLRRAQQEISAQYPYPMLIRIKGKRFVQTRLAAPDMTSINSGDNFILITQTKLYHLIGEYSNRMERSKSLDVVAHILQKKEFGCNLHTKVVTLQEESVAGSPSWDSFFEVLGCSTAERRIRDDVELLGDEADEAYEGRVISRNKIWRVMYGDELDEKLLPIREYWGTVPKHSLLQPGEVLIFDFGPEMYVWSGSKAPVDKKKLGFRLAQEMFEMEGLGKEFDDVKGTKSAACKEAAIRRPSWCWLRKINQHMEPILFIEKFFDWPEEIGRIRVGKNRSNSIKDEQRTAALEAAAAMFVPCDASVLSRAYHDQPAEVSLVLEGFDVKRGRVHVDKQERRNYTITTTRLQTWAISEFSKSEVGDSQLGHFNSASTYVIRWQYTISFVGKDLKGNQSKHNANTIGGRDRCAYFFWHGKRSKITEQGASALMTVELDDLEEKRDLERTNSSSSSGAGAVSSSSSGGGAGGVSSSRGPQIRVEQNYEPPAFLALFNGKMFIHDSQVDPHHHQQDLVGAPIRNPHPRLFVTLGTDHEEAHFLQVACSPDSFRSNGCFLLLDFELRIVFLWAGNHCSSELKKIGVSGATSTLKNGNWSPSMVKVVTLKEGCETDAFWSCLLGSRDAPIPHSNLVSATVPVEMFRFTSINGRFEAIPVISPRRHAAAYEPFPVVQEDLYGPSVSQPSMFLVLSPDNTVYLWQGWRRIIKREFVPEDEDISQQAVDSIPLTSIWPKYRRCSVETGLNYARFKSVENAYLVYAGVEPHHFTHIFPYWDYNFPSTREAHDYHLAEGKRPGERAHLVAVLEELTAKRTYTVEELMEKPEGVDLSRLEDYVSDQDFERLFSMPRAQFAQLQSWRKTELKKAVGLF